MATKCAVCAKAWARKQPDSDGVSRCYGHTIDRDTLRDTTTDPPPIATLSNRAGILQACNDALRIAKSKRDPHGMVAAARVAIAACQMVDPQAPEQELGGFVVRIVSRDSPPARLPAPEPEPRADAE